MLAYLLAGAATAALVVSQRAADASSGSTYRLLFVVLLGSAALGGFGPGVMTMVLSVVLAAFWILPAERHPLEWATRELLDLATFAGISLFFAWVVARFRESRRRARTVEQDQARRGSEMGSHAESTERGEQDDALRDAQARLERFLTHTPLGVVEWDSRFRVLSFSPRAEQVLGWSAPEVVGKSVHEIPWIAPEALGLIRTVMDGIVSGTHPSGTSRVRNLRKDGSAIDCEWYSSSLYDNSGKLQTVLTLVQDVSARARVEDALEESRNRLALFIEHAPAAIAMFDRDMRYIAASRRYLAEYGVADRNVLGQSHYELHPELPEQLRAAHRRCLAGAVERCEEESFVGGDGRTRWTRWELRPWLDAQGAIGGLVLFIEEITERKEMEARIHQADRLAALGTLMRGMSHEINNPLAVVMNNLEFLTTVVSSLPVRTLAADSELERSFHFDLREALADAMRGAARVKSIVKDMNAIAPHGPSPRAGSLPSAMRTALNLAAGELAACAEVHVDLPDLPAVSVCEEDLVRVFDSLLLNAGQATASVPNSVRVVASQPGPDRVLVSISDTGVGMSPEVLARVFEPFFTTREIGKGKGLGLTACRGIVDSAGGELSIQSSAGLGTTVTVILPVR